MPTVEPRHLAAWKMAAEHTRPGIDNAPPTYGATLRPLKRKRLKLEMLVEAEPEAPVELLAND